MGSVAPVVMSVLVFSGGAQFAALSVLQGGGAALAAITAGMLMNARWLPMSFAMTPPCAAAGCAAPARRRRSSTPRS